METVKDRCIKRPSISIIQISMNKLEKRLPKEFFKNIYEPKLVNIVMNTVKTPYFQLYHKLTLFIGRC